MLISLEEKLSEAVWVAHSLYVRSKTSGSSANLSFLHEGNIYITVSGSCFGTLEESDFARMSMEGESLDSKKCSKEFELHRALYEKGSGVNAVIHTHSTFAALWSCLIHENMNDVIPAYTPYLRMKLGKVVAVPYHRPGSPELFDSFRKCLTDTNGYLLKNHGPIVGAQTIMDAYYSLEELEESAKIAWMLRNEPDKEAIMI